MTRIRAHLIVLLAALVLLAGSAFWLAAHQANNPSELDNVALVDGAATEQVRTEVAHALTSVFSYDYANPAAAQSAADTYLTDRAR